MENAGSIASLAFALVVWPLVYNGLLRAMRRAAIPSPFGFEFLIAFATIGQLFLLPLYAGAPFTVLCYIAFYIFFALLSLVCAIRLAFHPCRSPFYPAALALLAVGIIVPWMLLYIGAV